jgi:hypothetical protein
MFLLMKNGLLEKGKTSTVSWCQMVQSEGLQNGNRLNRWTSTNAFGNSENNSWCPSLHVQYPHSNLNPLCLTISYNHVWRDPHCSSVPSHYSMLLFVGSDGWFIVSIKRSQYASGNLWIILNLWLYNKTYLNRPWFDICILLYTV